MTLFIEKLQDALLLRLKANTDALSINYENRIMGEPETLTLKELRTVFILAGVKSIQIDNTTISL
jgi:hypothetical protein